MGSSSSTLSSPATAASLNLPPVEDDISELRVDKLEQGSQYIRPYRMRFTHNGHKRAWDLLNGHDAVAVLIHNTTSDTVVLVRQFRPAVFYHSTSGCEVAPSRPDTGYTLELPAGLVDKKGKSLQQIASEECLEEAGYALDPDRLTKLNTVFGSVGLKAGCLTLFYTQATDDDIVEGAGGGLRHEGEFLDVVHLPVADVPALLSQDEVPIPTGLGYALEWLLARQAAQHAHWTSASVGAAGFLAGAVVGGLVVWGMGGFRRSKQQA